MRKRGAGAAHVKDLVEPPAHHDAMGLVVFYAATRITVDSGADVAHGEAWAGMKLITQRVCRMSFL